MDANFIRQIKLGEVDTSLYPYSIPAVKQIESIQFTSPVTFFVGENGSGKSTLSEAIAVAAGFNAEGGTKNYSFSSQDTTSSLSENIILVRGHKRERSGYFLRAESFYTTANYADSGTSDMAGNPYPILFDGKRIHEQSHGEAFLSIVKTFRAGLYIFDEPESALSPKRIIALMAEIHQLVKQGSQFIIATHSPMLLAYPNAKIYQLSKDGIDEVAFDDIDHVKIIKEFLDNPKEYIDRFIED